MRGRHDIGLVAAVDDHVVRALVGCQVLATEIPSDVHQLDRVERAAALPRLGRGVRRHVPSNEYSTEIKPRS